MFNYKKIGFLFLVLISIFTLTGLFANASDYAYILKIDSSTVYPTTIYPGSVVSVNITVENISSISDAKNVNFELLPNNNINYVKKNDSLDIVKFSQTGTAVLSFEVNSDTPGGYYSIPIRITYQRDDQNYIIDTQVSINVSSYNKMNIILTGYPKANVYLDSNVTITGILQNEGTGTLTGSTIKLNYSGTLIPLSQTSIFVGDVPPGKSIPFEFNVKVPKTADIGIYDLNVYGSDVSGDTDTEKFSFIAEDLPSLIISSIDKSIQGDKSFLSQGDTFSLSIQLENISKSRAKAVSMRLLDLNKEGITGTDLAYVGSIDSFDSGAGVFDLAINSDCKTGNKYLKFQISYEDEYGVTHDINKEIDILISQKHKSNGFWVYLILVLVIVAVVLFFYKRNQKAKKIKALK